MSELARAYGWHRRCRGSVVGTHADGWIHVQCYGCGVSGYAALSGHVFGGLLSHPVDLMERATAHWLEFHGECSGEIHMSRVETESLRRLTRVLRCLTHGTEFVIEVP